MVLLNAVTFEVGSLAALGLGPAGQEAGGRPPAQLSPALAHLAGQLSLTGGGLEVLAPGSEGSRCGATPRCAPLRFIVACPQTHV